MENQPTKDEKISKIISTLRDLRKNKILLKCKFQNEGVTDGWIVKNILFEGYIVEITLIQSIKSSSKDWKEVRLDSDELDGLVKLNPDLFK